MPVRKPYSTLIRCSEKSNRSGPRQVTQYLLEVFHLPRRSIRIKRCRRVDTRRFAQTQLLDIAFEEGRASSGAPVILLHGWPEAAASWKQVASMLQHNGFRTIAPYLRGSYPTEFRSADTPRYAGAVAMAHDVIDLADNLEMSSFLSPDIPTVMMQGALDFCDLPSGSEGQEKYFPKGYERILLEDVGHFPHREAPSAVADAWLRFSRMSLPI
jgi:pimeloyl-ACP methyl ester carboxylesterase